MKKMFYISLLIAGHEAMQASHGTILFNNRDDTKPYVNELETEIFFANPNGLDLDIYKQSLTTINNSSIDELSENSKQKESVSELEQLAKAKTHLLSNQITSENLNKENKHLLKKLSRANRIMNICKTIASLGSNLFSVDLIKFIIISSRNGQNTLL